MFAQSSLGGLQKLIETFVEKVMLYDDGQRLSSVSRKAAHHLLRNIKSLKS